MGNCFNCEHAIVKFKDTGNIENDMLLIENSCIDVDTYCKCLKNNTINMKNFYNTYGHMHISKSNNINFECFKQKEIDIKLDYLLNLLDKIS